VPQIKYMLCAAGTTGPNCTTHPMVHRHQHYMYWQYSCNTAALVAETVFSTEKHQTVITQPIVGVGCSRHSTNSQLLAAAPS
jgi:hypothetical protein